MRLLLTALAALAALLCACGSSSARSSAGAGPPCGPAGARTVAADAQARVYVKNGRVYGCSDRARRSYILGATTCRPAGPMIAPVALAGRLVAYGSEQCGIDTGSAEVVLQRLSDGKVLDREPGTTARLKPESYVQVTAVVLARGGAFAWISTAHSVTGAGAYATEVLAHDRNGLRRLDSGAGIATGSLRLAGRTVRWRDNGRARSATLA